MQNHLFLDGSLELYRPSDNLTHTWDYSSALQDKMVECARIWALGESLDEVCPYYLQEEWKRNKNKIKSFIKSFQKVGLDVSNHNYMDLIPEKFIRKFLQNKNQISEHVFQTFKRPKFQTLKV